MSQFRMVEMFGEKWPVSLAEKYAVLYWQKGVAHVDYFIDWKKGLNFWSLRERDPYWKVMIVAVIQTKDLWILAQRVNEESPNYVVEWQDAIESGYEPVMPVERREKRAWER